MEWTERMSAAVDYIENNLTGEVDFHEAARKANCSPFHFSRIFTIVTGVTLSEYVRRRRLTLAASELSHGKAKVIDVALKYGYDSPDAFTRAFRNVHGITPMAAREPGVQLVAYPRIFFQIVLTGGKDMDYQIIEKPAFEVVGEIKKISTVNNVNFIEVPRFWDEFIEKGHIDTLMDLSQCKPGPVTGASDIGICIPIKNTMDAFTYMIAIEKPDKEIPGEFEILTIPEATWAVFESIGPMPDAIQKVWKGIFQEWFPSTGYKHAEKPELEVYFPGDPQSPDYRCQVWIPIKEK